MTAVPWSGPPFDVDAGRALAENLRREPVDRALADSAAVEIRRACDEIERVKAAAKEQAARDRSLIGELENYVDQKPSREALLAELARLQEAARVDRLRWRHVEDPCETCDGAGVRSYGNSSTWRGGMGAAAITVDVCDACWGSGDRWRRGIDLRALRGEEAGRVAKAAVTALADAAGVAYRSARVDVDRIVQHLEALADKRNTTHVLQDLTQALANVLRRGIGMPERKTR